jgi:glucose-1-phosphate thymidylyltransferase
MSGAAKALILTDGLLDPSRYRALGVRVCPLVPIANRPLVLHVLDGLRAAGVHEAAIVGDGAARAEIAGAVGEGIDGVTVRYVDRPDTRALDAPAVIVQPADALLRNPLDGLAYDVASARIDAAVVRLPALPPSAGEDTDPPATPAVGACLLGARTTAAVAATLGDGAAAGADRLAAALDASSAHVRTSEVRGCRACSDGDDGLLRANRLVLEALSATATPPPAVAGAEIQGPAIVHPSAELHATLVRGPAVIGPNARLNDVYIGPYTSIAEDVVIEGAEIEHSLVLAGAEVRYPGVRLTSSIVGPRARLVRDFHLPRGMRVAVGADALVALS